MNLGLGPHGRSNRFSRMAGRRNGLRSKAALPVLAMILGAALSMPAAAASEIGLAVKGGSVVRNNGIVTVWANSPQAVLTLSNPGTSFYQAKIQWLNVPTGAFVTTPQGVSDGASRDGTLRTAISVPGGSEGVWKLDPNLKGNFQFVVTGGGLGGLTKAPQTNFAVHLGNSGYPMDRFIEALQTYRFPTYTLRGTRDPAKAYQSKFGQAPSAFTVDGTAFIFLDNLSGRLGSEQTRWLQERLAQNREANVQRTFVFMPLPVVDPRKGRNDGIRDREEAVKLLELFKQNRVEAVFAGHLPMVHRSTWRDVEQVIVGGAYALAVDVTPNDVSIRRL